MEKMMLIYLHNNKKYHRLLLKVLVITKTSVLNFVNS